MRTCHFHSDRPGIGICMRCRAVICAACCTRINGVNHCHACLKALSGRGDEKTRGNLGMFVVGVFWGIASLVLFVLCWAVSGKMAP